MSDTATTVRVCADAGNAIYVNDSRITDGSTKWGVKRVLFEFECARADVVSNLAKLGLTEHVRRIDTEPYLTQAKAQEPRP